MNPPPAGRPRKNPKAPRVTLAVRVDPGTKKLLAKHAKRSNRSLGEMFDIVVNSYDLMQ